jgi:hypothetical protein
MACGLFRIHVIVLIPTVLSYHLRTSVSVVDFRLAFDSTTSPQKLETRATVFHGAEGFTTGARVCERRPGAKRDTLVPETYNTKAHPRRSKHEGGVPSQ